MAKQYDALISEADTLTPNEQALLFMRAALLVECLDTLGELAQQCQDLRRELAELPYTSTAERDRLMCEYNTKREQYKSTKAWQDPHKNNLAKTLYVIQCRRASEIEPSEKPLAPDA